MSQYQKWKILLQYFRTENRKDILAILKSTGVAEFALTLPPPWQHLAPPSRIIHMSCVTKQQLHVVQHQSENPFQSRTTITFGATSNKARVVPSSLQEGGPSGFSGSKRQTDFRKTLSSLQEGGPSGFSGSKRQKDFRKTLSSLQEGGPSGWSG